jgi:Uri superfamily endonuclease
VLACTRKRSIRIGRLGTFELQPGYYVYAGSAFGPGGLAARLGRHLRPSLRLRWHIDYLRAHTVPVEFWTIEGLRREHRWAAALGSLAGAAIPLAGFGASDCACRSHLFFFERRPSAALGRRLGGARRTVLSLKRDLEHLQ